VEYKRGKQKLDFIIEEQNKITVIEVKAGERQEPRFLACSH